MKKKVNIDEEDLFFTEQDKTLVAGLDRLNVPSIELVELLKNGEMTCSKVLDPILPSEKE